MIAPRADESSCTCDQGYTTPQNTLLTSPQCNRCDINTNYVRKGRGTSAGTGTGTAINTGIISTTDTCVHAPTRIANQTLPLSIIDGTLVINIYNISNDIGICTYNTLIYTGYISQGDGPQRLITWTHTQLPLIIVDLVDNLYVTITVSPNCGLG
jgi:hypothetical protein